MMFRHRAVPYLKGLSEGGDRLPHGEKPSASGESAAEALLRDLMNSLHNPTLAPYAKPTGTELRVTAHARTEAEALARITPVVDQVKALLGDKVIGVDVSCLEEVCYGLLKERGSPWAPPSPAPAVSWPSFSPTCPAPLPCFGGALSAIPMR